MWHSLTGMPESNNIKRSDCAPRPLHDLKPFCSAFSDLIFYFLKRDNREKFAASALFVVNKSASVTMKTHKQNKLVQLNHEHDMIQTHQL